MKTHKLPITLVEQVQCLLRPVFLGSCLFGLAGNGLTVFGQSENISVSNASELAAALENVLGGETILLASGDYGALDDTDHDGYENLVELAAGSNPNFSDSANFVNVSIEQVGEDRFLNIAYRQLPSTFHLIFTVEFSENMITWSVGGNGYSRIDENEIEWMLFQYPTPLARVERIYTRISLR